MEFRTLGKTGLSVSALGFGASPLGGVFGAVDEAEGVRAVHRALKLGINYFDVAPFYGATRAETALGNALKDVPRDRYLLATKIGRYGPTEFDFSAERTRRSVDESLLRLHTDVIDVIQCHDIEFGSIEQVIIETIPTLRDLQAQGKVRFIGISGLPLAIFPKVIERTEVDTALSYCHYTLFDTTFDTLFSYLQSKGVGVINAAPLSMGLLTDSGIPDWHPASPELREACAQAARHCRERGADISELALQFALANPDIATTLVGMADVATVERNVACVGNAPDPELLAEVRAILEPVRNQTWPSGRPENNA